MNISFAEYEIGRAAIFVRKKTQNNAHSRKMARPDQNTQR